MLTLNPGTASFTRRAALLVSGVLLLLSANSAWAYPPADKTYAAPWTGLNTYDQTSQTYGCIAGDSGGAEGCMKGLMASQGLPDQVSPWKELSGSDCSTWGYLSTTCFTANFAKLVNGFPSNNTTTLVGQNCAYGGTDGTAGGLSQPGYCLILATPPPQTGCQQCQAASVGNPISAGSGNKHETMTDYRGGGAFPLVFSRTYNSSISSQSAESIGKGWSTNIGGHLSIAPRGQLVLCQEPAGGRLWYLCPMVPLASGTSPIEVTVWGADGSQNVFTYQYSSAPDGTALATEQTAAGQLFFVNSLPAPATGGGFKYLRTDGYTQYFNSTGALMAVQNPGGLSQTYQYNTANQLTSITDPFSRTLSFTYYSTSDSRNGLVYQMKNPLGGFFTYTYSTDGNNNLISVQYPDQSLVQYKYGENGAPVNALTGIVDENNNRYVTWGYDANGHANSSQHAGGVDSFSISYTTDVNGYVTSSQVTEPTGLVRTLTFNTINFQTLLSGVTTPCTECGDKTKSLTYDSNGFVASNTDFDGNVTQYTHDGFGNETSRTEGYQTSAARTITTQWNYSFNEPALITEPGRTTAYTYDAQGRMLTKTVTDTATNVVRTTTYSYYSTGTAAGLLKTVTDPLNHGTSYSYDTQGNLSSVTNALNQVTQITQYDANGMPLTIVDSNGITTTLTYDLRQRLLTRTVAGATTTFTYDKVGNLTQVTLSTGSYLKYSYDAAHRLTGIIDAVGDSISYTLDNLGNRTTEQTHDPSNALTKTLSRTYNNLNQLLTIVSGAGQTTSYAPDQNGNVTGITDPMTFATGQTFDALNRLVSVVDPENGKTNYNYDALDRVTEVTDPNHLNTNYYYDAFGDVSSQVSPDTGTTGYTYDLDGNRLTKADSRGVQATYTYDVLNRLTGISYPDASRNVSYTYDQGSYGIGHLTGMTDASGTTTYSYDPHGNTAQKVVTLGGHTFTVGYQYDTADNLTGMTYPSGKQVNYVRDTAERVTSVTVNNSTVVSGITYEPFGPITSFTYGNGLTENRTYDQDYRLTGITVPNVLSRTLTDNADNDITAITDNLNSANSQTLGYDTLNRLTSANGLYGTQSYQYDLDGNRTQETLGGSSTNLGYDTLTPSNHLLSVGAQTYQYDAVGNLLSDGSHTYTYDVANRLTGHDASPTSYLYNGLGQRAVKNPIDNSTPTVNITAPAGGTALKGTVNVTASAFDDFGIASVQFKLDGTNLGSPISSAPYTYSWNTASATDGTHSLTAVATDANGRISTSASITVTVDNTPPTVSLTAPASGAYMKGTVIVTANASDNVGVASVQFQLDGANLGSQFTTAPYAISWDTTTVAGGSHNLTAVARDAAGNVTTSTVASVTVDNVPPTVSITAPVANAYLRGTVSVSATASASYGVGISSVQLQLDGANLGAAVTAAPYSVSWDTTTATGGSHVLTAVAKDAAGNTTTATAVNVTVDNTAPTVSITAPTSGSQVAFTVTVSANASDNVSVASVQFQRGGHNLGAPVTTAPYSYSWNTVPWSSTSQTLTAIVTDEAGNTTTSAPVTVTVLNKGATANSGTLTTNVDIAGSGTLSATHSYSGQSLTFTLGSTLPSHGSVTITNAATGAYTYTPTAGYSGSDSFAFWATDQYGYISSPAIVNVTVNDIAATVSDGSVSTVPNRAVTGTLLVTKAYVEQTYTIAVDSTPLNGNVTITNAATGAFTYTPNAGYTGTDNFFFKATDSYGTASTSHNETINVTGPLGSLSPLSANFHSVNVGNTSMSQSFTLRNNGNAVLTGISISLGGSNPNQFSITSNNCGTSLVVGDQCWVNVVFSPTSAGSLAAQLVVSDSDVSSPQISNLTGTGQGISTLSPSSGLIFGNVNKGSNSTLTATLTNGATAAININQVLISGTGFSQTNNCGSSLGAGASCTISVKFNPTSDTSYSGTLTVKTNGTPVNLNLALTGTGVN